MSEEVAEMEFLEEDSGFDPNAVNRLAMLRLNNQINTCVDHHTTGEPEPLMDPCTMCGSVKKRSPYSSSLQEPNAKRITLNPPSSSAGAVGDHRLRGFAKISLPVAPPSISPPTNSNPTLLRCSSLPIDYPGVNDAGALDAQFPGNLSNSGNFLNPTTPENLKIGFPASINPSSTKEASAPSASASLPILLRRTLSDPTPAYPAVTTTPPRPPSAKKSLHSPSSVGRNSFKGGSPNAKRLKRMKDRMKEMKQWCEELIREDVEESEFEEDTSNTPQVGSETEPVEAAWVERTGESSIIHFKCLCGKGYQILLHGNNCYYMLMPFEQENCETETEEKLSVERHGEWLYIFTQCPCTKGYMILLSGNDCYYKLVDGVSS